MADAASAGRVADEPHRVIAVFDQMMTCTQARELGKAFGAMGFTARMVGGTVAELAALGAKLKSELQDNG